MALARRSRWMTLCYPLFLFILLAYGAYPGSTRAQARSHTVLDAKNILVLHAFETRAPVFAQTDMGLSKTLQSGGIPIQNQFFQSLDLRRNPGPEYRKLLVEEMRVRSGHRNYDLIITMYPEALEFALDDCRDIFPDVPILAMYLPQSYRLPETKRRIIAHFAPLDIIGTFEIALKLVPRAKRVFVVSGAHEIDRTIEDEARRVFKKWEGRLEFRYMSPTLTQRLNQVSRAPIFGLLDAALGYGIVGGSLINFEHIGVRAGDLVLDILGGAPTPENIPRFLKVPSMPMFDWRQLRRWHLSESALPRGGIVINKELTFWDLRYYALGVLVFFIGQWLLIVGLFVQKRRRRSAEESLGRKIMELDQFFNVTVDLLGIATTDCYFLRLNPTWERVLGYRTEEVVAKRFFDFVHPDDLAGTREAVSNVLSQEKVSSFENRFRCKDGSYRWLEWTAARAGGLIYVAARDQTERLKAEDEGRQRREELAHMNRIALLGELTTSLAHEINQPLTAILSNAGAAQNFLSQSTPDFGEVRQILDDIIRDDRRASEVIRRVRSLVKKEKPRQEPLDLNTVIRQVVDLIRGDSLLKGLSIRMDLRPGLAKINGDLIQLQQVVLNLILNSAAAMRNSPRAQRKIIVRTAMPDNTTVKASVTDFGTGIDENNIARLFEPFFTTKPDGLGMGLSISQGIIKAHGGTMEASNNPEGGATFAFALPAHQGDPS